MRKLTLSLLIGGILISPIITREVRAMDPITIAILAPVAVKCAEIAAPYVWRGLQNGGQHLYRIGINLIDIFRLPVGMLQATLGIPFNHFSPGIKNIIEGSLAPFNLIVNIVLLPLTFCGININPG